MKRVHAIVLVVVALFTLGGFAAEDAQEILQSVKRKYDAIKDAELKFLQRTTSQLSASKQSIAGTLFVKKQKFRVEVEGQTIITDGDTIWSYNAATKQVVIDKFKKNSRTLSPEKILAAAPTNYSASLVGTEKIGKYATRVLQLVPKDEASLITTMKIWVDDAWLIRKAEVSDLNGTITSYFVNELKLNANIPDSRFTYRIPKGVEAVDLR
jgi:chaperone LolA